MIIATLPETEFDRLHEQQTQGYEAMSGPTVTCLHVLAIEKVSPHKVAYGDTLDAQ